MTLKPSSRYRVGSALVGQAELRRRISMAVHEALSQRVVVLHHMISRLSDIP